MRVLYKYIFQYLKNFYLIKVNIKIEIVEM